MRDMFNFRKLSEIQYPLFATDTNSSADGQDAAAVTQNESTPLAREARSEIYERARIIYDRARRKGRRRIAGII